MRVPVAPSSFYREHGRPHAVFAYGLVLFLTPSEYAAVRKLDADGKIHDATEEQITAHDRWFEEAQEQTCRDWAELARLFGAEDGA